MCIRRSRLGLIGLMLPLLAAPLAARAVTIQVAAGKAERAEGGDGICTLREAVDVANGEPPLDCTPEGDEEEVIIEVPAGTYTLTEGPLGITSGNVSIRGAGAGSTILRNAGTSSLYRRRVLTVDEGVHATLSRLEIRDGSHPFAGGGIRNEGSLTLVDCIVRNNRTTEGSGGGGGIRNYGLLDLARTLVADNRSSGRGGGIYSSGTLLIHRSSFSGNAGADGGGLYARGTFPVQIRRSSLTGNVASNGGGIYAAVDNVVSIVNSTLSGNAAAQVGGGIHNAPSTILQLSHVTIANNRAGSSGGGLYNQGNAYVKSSILADNVAPVSPDVWGAIGSEGSNLVGLREGASGFGDSDLAGVDQPLAPKLAPLASAASFGPPGNESLVHRPRLGSPAIDRGDCTDYLDEEPGEEGIDQRGLARPQQGACDIGAFETRGVRTVKSTPLPDAQGCPSGGWTRVDVGVDENADGTLQAAEIDSTSYVCNNFLVVVTESLACERGGTTITSGFDVDGDGALASGADVIVSAEEVCNGAPGAQGPQGETGLPGYNAVVRVTPEPNGAHCAQGGQKIEYGVDWNENGVLDDIEIPADQSPTYVCNGAPGESGAPGAPGAPGASGHNSLVLVLEEPPGEHCTYGGQRIEVGLELDDNDVLDEKEVTWAAYVCNGAPGETGATGPRGPAGAQGVPGPQGPVGLQGAKGSGCTAATGGDGVSWLPPMLAALLLLRRRSRRSA
jgi:predicted outer membrane repeat protein